ncbi:conserved hypothetical protein [Leishmania infantum JPCM5]|uniref:Protein_of_uncharacterized_function_(DUF3735 )/Abscisic_acid_G-protein_coupled_receptor_-_putative n=2 Tax=Leishmania infantum TaxID=5671 RepID=A0A6L0WJ78_LEIIN|nr:conserved hypothetical protein [Leishmania infantum JPCM5]CAC9448266.1 Protein_of_uncharacterised_function_(DUF3735)/Abscisic_acid_G-protein_coupled_receptor_-_putative [Leishmania infantum]CAM65596.1 conserved hypothetical protein [Leishmania infantum JPCM5]SUZ39219.1 Protein_of_uncharacterised_function_(DUF3735)/Abscisic_acid_G-protein_coupled_receptor_-_putative [Leishmania infantum]|eukprot:XP_001463242.1 conserved hypothetical protein [Leishmania infantum JPCM5]
MSVFYVAASYAVFFYFGELLMRLVVVQPLSDASAVRWCFASTFALSVSLFSAVLVDMAEASLLPSAAASSTAAAEGGASGIAGAGGKWASWLSMMSLLFHPLMRVSARSFTWLLLLLLSTVLVACPAVFVISLLRHLVVRGSGRRTAGKRFCSSRRSSRSASGFWGSGASHLYSSRFSSRSRSELSSLFRHDCEDTTRSRGLCGRLRWVLVCLLVVAALVCAGVWTARVMALDVHAVRHTSIATVRRVYTQLQTRTTMLNVPREIEHKSTSGAGGDTATRSSAQEAGQMRSVAEGVLEAAADRVAELLVDAKVEVPGGGGDADGQAQLPQQPRRPFPVAEAVHAMPSAAADLHALVCAITSRVATVGVAMIGLLSGYAAVTSPCLFLAPYTYWRGREEDLRKAQQNFNKKLCYVLNSYGAAQRQIAALQYSVLHEEWPSPAFAAGSPSPHRGHSSSRPKQSPALYSAGAGFDPVNPYHAPYPGFDGSGGISDSPAQGRLLGGSDLRQSTGLGNQSAPSHAPQRQTQNQSPSGAVGWLQQKLSNAAHAVAGGASPGGRLYPKSPTSAVSNPTLSRQRAIARISTLRSESAASRFLSLSMYLQLHEVEGMLREAQRGATWVGRWYAGLGVAMALYSAVKISLTVASLWLFKASTQDPVTQAVTLLENTFILRRRNAEGAVSFSVTAVEVSTHVVLALALVVNGWMLLNSIRGVLLALFHVTMSFSGSAICRPETISVGLSMMIGVYFIGQLVMLRSSLPGTVANTPGGAPPPDGTAAPNVLLAVLGSLPYYYYQRLSDWCFLVGCGGAVVVRSVVLRDTMLSVVYTASGGEEQHVVG